MPFHHLYILDQKSDILISEVFRHIGNVNISYIFDHFVFADEVRQNGNIITIPGRAYKVIYLSHEDIYFVALIGDKDLTAPLFGYLRQLLSLIRQITECRVVDSRLISNNISLVQEIIDDTLDFGIPTNTDLSFLKSVFSQKEIKTEKNKKNIAESSEKITVQATGAVAYRKEGINYKRNEVYVDVVERVNALVSSGQLLSSEIEGSILMKSILSGMPNCKLGLTGMTGAASNETLDLDSINFHHCVKADSFYHDHSVTFIPPDGDFELLRYRVSRNIQPPILVTPILNFGPGKISLSLDLKANFNADSGLSSSVNATDVVVRIPLPPGYAGFSQNHCSAGSIKENEDKSALAWRISELQAQSVNSVSIDFAIHGLDSNDPWSNRKPISCDFTVWRLGCGLRLKYMRIEESKLGYHADTRVRYVTESGRYEVKF